MKRLFLLSLLSLLPLAAENEFFAMDNGLSDVKTIAGKAELLNELGYDGVTWRPGNTGETVREMSAKGVKVHALMLNLPVSNKEQAAPLPLADIEALKGTDAILWVQLTRKGGDDADAARALRRLNAVAKPLALRIAIYPHVNNHVESLEEALRVADLVADDNVGVSLTLCHQLKRQGVQDLAPLLKKALPKLFLVLVSGADTGDTKAMGWDKLIQPLGNGSYDVGSLLKTLQELDYQGSLGVIGFGLKQPAKDHLKQSIEFWRRVSTSSTALVFLIAGQSNAGGVAAFSPESNEKSGMAGKHPTTPGSTAKEVGIPTTMDAYPRSFIWGRGFERLTPGRNLKGGYHDPSRHGIELPMAMLLEKKHPDADKFFIKHGPGGHNLHTQWKAGSGSDYRSFKAQLDAAMADLKKRYRNIRVIGLYWDQGESDKAKAAEYATNLRALFTAFRADTGIPDLRIFVRKLIFQHDDGGYAPIIAAQAEISEGDPNAHLLDLDLGSNEANFKAWAWTDNNGHLSSKAYLELGNRIMSITGPNQTKNR